VDTKLLEESIYCSLGYFRKEFWKERGEGKFEKIIS